MVIAAGGINVEAVTGLVLAAAAIATLSGAWYRRYVGRSRSELRRKDQLEGWTDDNGRWHPGFIDIMAGYREGDAVHEPLPRRVDALERGMANHREDPRAHGGTRS